MKANINIEKKNKKVYVTVEVRKQCHRNYNHILQYGTQDVLHYLEEEGIKVGNCIQEAKVFNRRQSTCEGTWVFETPAPPKTRKKTTTKKVEKVLDFSSEDVIINETFEQKED